jgi:hypothetical protein
VGRSAPGGATRLYLSGPAATEVAALFAPTDLEAVALGDDVAAASALKMCYAAWTKGTSALLLAIRAAADAHGVEEALLAEWARSQPDLAARSQAAAGTARKAWRFAGEMDQIAACFAEAGLPDGLPAPPPSCTAVWPPSRTWKTTRRSARCWVGYRRNERPVLDADAAVVAFGPHVDGDHRSADRSGSGWPGRVTLAPGLA